jgi:hypothetical protein
MIARGEVPNMAEILRIRKVADRSQPRPAFNEVTGEPLTDLEPWPLHGVAFEGDPPAVTSAGESWIAEAIREGWATGVGERVVHRPGGPADNVWAKTHTFRHYAAIEFHTVDGVVEYRVTHQPDKYADPGDDTTPVTTGAYEAGATRVDHFYRLELEG